MWCISDSGEIAVQGKQRNEVKKNEEGKEEEQLGRRKWK
jgi:hypothetical protein